MSRVLRQAGVGTLPRVIGSRVEVPLDPELAGLLRDAAAQGFERGRRAGFQEGREAAVSDVPAAVRAELDEGLRALARMQADNAAGVVALALQIARAVLEREPSDGGGVLAARIRTALTALDDGPLVVSVHPDDLESTAAAVLDRDDVSVAPDPALLPGEARIAGPWSHADLTREGALAAVAEALQDLG